MSASAPIRMRYAWQRISAVLLLLRPFNFVLFMLGVALGGLLAAGPRAFEGEDAVRLLLAGLSAALIGGAANSLNDVFDLEIDRINRPERPLPAGIIPPRTAELLWGIGSLGGVLLSFWLSPVHVVLAVISAGLLYLYNAYLKRTVLVGNGIVAFVTSLALVYGGWAVGEPGPALVGAVFAFLTTFARELVKDIEDIAGDRADGACTLAVVYGTRAAARATAVLVALTILLTPFPYGLLYYGGLFLFLIFIADALLLRVLWFLLAPEPERHAERVSRLLKMAMVVGMVALALSWVSG